MCASWEYCAVSIDLRMFKRLTARLQSENDTQINMMRRLVGLGSCERRKEKSVDPSVGARRIGVVEFREGKDVRAHTFAKCCFVLGQVRAPNENVGCPTEGEDYASYSIQSSKSARCSTK